MKFQAAHYHPCSAPGCKGEMACWGGPEPEDGCSGDPAYPTCEDHQWMPQCEWCGAYEDWAGELMRWDGDTICRACFWDERADEGG